MSKIKFSNVLTIASLCALFLAPFVTYFFSEATLSQQITPYITMKDAIQSLIILLLSVIVILKIFLDSIQNFLRWSSVYSEVEHSYFYSADKSVTIRSSYLFLNGRNNDLATLPKENLLWHETISSKAIFYRLFYRGYLQDRVIHSAPPQIYASNVEREGEFLSWEPRVKPPLRKKERIGFMVEIYTPNTEAKAFTSGGTTLGFGVHHRTKSVQVTAYAPFGYKFVLVDPIISLRDAESLDEVPINRSKLAFPEISPDSSVLTYRVKKPKEGFRYWVHYRFEEHSIDN